MDREKSNEWDRATKSMVKFDKDVQKAVKEIKDSQKPPPSYAHVADPYTDTSRSKK